MPLLPLGRMYLRPYHYAMKLNNLVLRIRFPVNHCFCCGIFPCDILYRMLCLSYRCIVLNYTPKCLPFPVHLLCDIDFVVVIV